jgi:hypothetical protein
MPNIQQTYRHQQLWNSFTPEQLRVIDEELARIREARWLAFDQGGDPQPTNTGTERERDPNPVAGDQGTGMVDNQDPSTGADELPTPGIQDGGQKPMNEQEAEAQVTTRPTSTTTTTASSTFNSSSIFSTGPTTITTTIDLTGPIPFTTTTICTTGTTTITTDTTPFITIDIDTEEESTKENDSKHQKTDCSEDTGTD